MNRGAPGSTQRVLSARTANDPSPVAKAASSYSVRSEKSGPIISGYELVEAASIRPDVEDEPPHPHARKFLEGTPRVPIGKDVAERRHLAQDSQISDSLREDGPLGCRLSHVEPRPRVRKLERLHRVVLRRERERAGSRVVGIPGLDLESRPYGRPWEELVGREDLSLRRRRRRMRPGERLRGDGLVDASAVPRDDAGALVPGHARLPGGHRRSTG